MKHPMKRIVPILLALAVLGCAVWYLFVYDRDFARDILISQARYLDSEGHHELAAMLYDQAYLHADKDDAVAIELARQYKQNGNYTKAEYTLTKAIASQPTVDLYVALCQTFVEQNKLMDAVNLLDRIPDPALKQELDALRPAAPTVDTTPGFYTQYLTVKVTSTDALAIISTNGEYPSLNTVGNQTSQHTVSLGQGETTIYALAVSKDSLVSPMGIYGYTIGGVIETVTFADPAMEAEIRQSLGFTPEMEVSTSDLWTIREFTVPQTATNYADLYKLTYLENLSIPNPTVEDLSGLSALVHLEELLISGGSITPQTLTAIANLPELTVLTLADCALVDITALETATGLTYLDLSYNSLRDLTALQSMSALETLYMTNNALTDLSALRPLTSLTNLNVSYNSIPSLEPIGSLTNLKYLDISHNLLTELTGIQNLTALTRLNVSYNSLTSVSILGDSKNLVELDISSNQIKDISALAAVSGLQEFTCAYNAITQLPGWEKSAALVWLNASYNNIKDLGPLAELQSLNVVNVDYNPSISSVEPLASCPNLIEVNLFGTKVRNVDSLTQQSIIVHYNPTGVSVEVTDPTQ